MNLTNRFQELWVKYGQFVRFVLVGMINTAFGYCVYAALLFCGLSYGPALLLATIAGVLFNFKTIGHFVFQSKDNRRVVFFVAVYCIVFGVNLLGLKLFALLGINPYISGAMLLLPMALLSFVLNKYFVFAK